MSIYFYCLEEIKKHDPLKYEQIIQDFLKWEECVIKIREYLKQLDPEIRVILWQRAFKALHNGLWDKYYEELDEPYKTYFKNCPCYGYKRMFSAQECIEIVESSPP